MQKSITQFYTWLGLASKLRDHYSDYFKTTKGLYYNSYFMLKADFKVVPSCDLPVGVTKIAHAKF